MSVVNAIPLLLGDEGYNISRSVRLRSSASAYFNRTPGSAGNRKTWTWSGWVKRGALGTTQWVLAVGGSTEYTIVRFNATDTLEYARVVSSAIDAQKISTAVYRDPSAWYHIVIVEDALNTVARIYVNGSEVAYSTNDNPSNVNGAVNNTVVHTMSGVLSGVGTNYFNGYMTEINFIDGSAKIPSDFGETDSATGVWKPKAYTGTYGTNGFYLNFSDNSSNTATTIGKDYSGNGNNWTPNNISVTAGVTYDSMLDVPTLYADGGNGRGNYAVLNPLISSSYQTLTNGNLTSKSNTSTDSGASYSTISTSLTGKWYMEFVADTSAGGGYPIVGTTLETSNLGNANGAAGIPGQNGGGSCGYRSNGQKYISGTSSSYGNSYVTNDVIGVAVDCDNGAVYFSKNGTWQNSGDPTSGATKTGAANTWTGGSTTFYIGVSGYTSGNGANANFGQRPFAYTPPTGFKALNTQNLPAPTILKGNKYFDAVLYTGDATSPRTVGGLVFQPDLVWVKQRSGTFPHILVDSVRGGSPGLAVLQSNATDAEYTTLGVGGGISSIASNGFVVTAGSGSNSNLNGSGSTYVGWQWKANGSAVTNTSGSITSQVNAGTSQGFSVVTYTGTGANATVGHGLGVAPKMIIVKERNAVRGWPVYHASLTSATYYIDLQTTAAQASASVIWNSTAPTSSVFSIGTDTGTNRSTGTYVAYCFSEVAGFSKFGSYTGNGSTDGPFVFCGFRPRFIMVKRTDSSTYGNWEMIDTARDTYNQAYLDLSANLSAAENATDGAAWDILSNGFKCRDGSSTGNKNVLGGTYIYAAFAEHPFKNSLAR